VSADDPAAALLARSAERLRTEPPRVLLLWGTDDPLFGPELLDEWRRTAPAAHVVELDGVGQLLLEQAPAEAIAAIRTFLTQMRVASASGVP
jgi:pimeloyl-ACP methyl ester carboxylesterase